MQHKNEYTTTCKKYECISQIKHCEEKKKQKIVHAVQFSLSEEQKQVMLEVKVIDTFKLFNGKRYEGVFWVLATFC